MLSKTGLHAIRAVVALARLPNGQYAGAVHVAREINAPENYLGKLLRLLATEGILRSQKGLNGGFCLARPAKKISLYDVVEPIEHLSRRNECILGRSECSEKNPCAIHHEWKAVRVGYERLLATTSIADLVKGGEPSQLLESRK